MTQPPPAPQPTGTVYLTVQGSVMTSSMLTPNAWINGYPVTVRYGANPIPVPAGPVRVDLSAQWMRTYGQASIAFMLAPGQTVPVYYAAPMHQFTTGSIGFEPVKRKGVTGFVAIMAVVALVMLGSLALLIFGS
ncbi:MAG: hypothetical protein QM597_00820 [Aeromicrobium sp.]|uniref:hypothetical protein n=1 Tax=Aeromicrobium sp. TaxID=1871063 RepID=UPI0039E5B821